jgi:hypothetical protein
LLLLTYPSRQLLGKRDLAHKNLSFGLALNRVDMKKDKAGNPYHKVNIALPTSQSYPSSSGPLIRVPFDQVNLFIHQITPEEYSGKRQSDISNSGSRLWFSLQEGISSSTGMVAPRWEPLRVNKSYTQASWLDYCVRQNIAAHRRNPDRVNLDYWWLKVLHSDGRKLLRGVSRTNPLDFLVMQQLAPTAKRRINHGRKPEKKPPFRPALYSTVGKLILPDLIQVMTQIAGDFRQRESTQKLYTTGSMGPSTKTLFTPSQTD